MGAPCENAERVCRDFIYAAQNRHQGPVNLLRLEKGYFITKPIMLVDAVFRKCSTGLSLDAATPGFSSLSAAGLGSLQDPPLSLLIVELIAFANAST
jgi:hypothetical protein